MAQEETNQTSSIVVPEGSGPVFMSVPPQRAPAVRAFLARLEKEDEDVSGFMFSLGLFGGIGPGSLNDSSPTLKNCVETNFGKDHTCDSDVFITP